MDWVDVLIELFSVVGEAEGLILFGGFSLFPTIHNEGELIDWCRRAFAPSLWFHIINVELDLKRLITHHIHPHMGINFL
jgi:hypothetical protein